LKKDEGVEILIALGHSGYELDLKMAAEISELDVVVGGHSHTFLWTGKKNPKSCFFDIGYHSYHI
jgi:2',3'-cyclic-nucleotide 2'-phosphodiesterase (5'-nucleotidase family)